MIVYQLKRFRFWLLRTSYSFYKEKLQRYSWVRLTIQNLLARQFIVNSKLIVRAREYAHSVQHGSKTISGEQKLIEPAPKTPSQFYEPPQGILPWFDPLAIKKNNSLSSEPKINMLIPSMEMVHMSGGPNTAIIFACHLATIGYSIRFISTNAGIEQDKEKIWGHMAELVGESYVIRERIEFVDGSNRSVEVEIGERDVFFATAWWTAQMAKYAVQYTQYDKFLYLIQDYEPLLHDASTEQALSEETYSLPHIPIINTELLFEFLCENNVGRFSDASHQNTAIVFNPAISKDVFFPEEKDPSSPKKTLLFYARPTKAKRNLFELGIVALRLAIEKNILSSDEWEFLAMGEDIAPVDLGHGATLTPLPWVGMSGYGKNIRNADILLSLMLSPHPSYPPLEKAACGGIAVTNSFSVKTAERLLEISSNIMAGYPSIEGIYETLCSAAQRVSTRDFSEQLTKFPTCWKEVVSPLAPLLSDEISKIRLGLDHTHKVQVNLIGYSSEKGYRQYQVKRLAYRRLAFQGSQISGLLSFITTVWDTPVEYLEVLAKSLFTQDGGTNFEWIILDNGCSAEDTIECLERISSHPCVTLHRVVENLGIVKGMRFVLEKATGTYVLPLDSDDYLYPDCVNVITQYVKEKDAALYYTDEDKLRGNDFDGPYFKPDWDPVLFSDQCYIAHLCVIDRELAIQFDAYSDQRANGCHDWDTFLRFIKNNFVPKHIPEVLYSWRMHPNSTAQNIKSKDYISTSHLYLLNKLSKIYSGTSDFQVTQSPLFDNTPDWRISSIDETKTIDNYLHLVLDDQLFRNTGKNLIEEDKNKVRIDVSISPDDISNLLKEGDFEFILLTPNEENKSTGETTSLLKEANDMFSLYSDSVMVGGRVFNQDNIIIGAGSFFGYGDGCGCPDIGRQVHDVGYFGQLHKRHLVDAVPIQFSVIKTEFLSEALNHYKKLSISINYLGPWLGAYAHRLNSKVLYSPYATFTTTLNLEEKVLDIEKSSFVYVNRDILDKGLLHSAFSRKKPYVLEDEITLISNHVNQLIESVIHDSNIISWCQPALVEWKFPIEKTRPSASFSIITPVYEGTDAKYFSDLAVTISAQTYKNYEWVILAQGSIPDSLGKVLTETAENNRRVKISYKDENVGIIQGMRFCLEQAENDFIVPVDSDDMIDKSALYSVACHLKVSVSDFVYTDEDQVIDSKLKHPYHRSGWDPLLYLSSSCIWHLCAFNRKKALGLSIYADIQAEFCQDWDTVTKFYFAGLKINHIPLILYHWRQHKDSFSNSGDSRAKRGTLDSTRAVFNNIINRVDSPELYSIESFPLNRGANELSLVRKPTTIDNMLAIIVEEQCGIHRCKKALVEQGFTHIEVVKNEDAKLFIKNLSSIINNVSSIDYTLIISSNCLPVGEHWLRESLRIYEMHDDVEVVSGRLINDGSVVSAGINKNEFGQLFDYMEGMQVSDPGSFALAYKPHSIYAPASELFFIRNDFVTTNLGSLSDLVSFSELGLAIGSLVEKQGKRVAYSPLVQVEYKKENVLHYASLIVKKNLVEISKT